MRVNMPVTTNERTFREEDGLISKTDLKGRITFVNDAFVYISGFAREELIGQPHNIVRHPDVPAEAYTDLWSTLKAGRPWTAIVKNRCKNGDFYWVEANVTPLREGNEVTGYISVRNKPSREQIIAAESLYQDIKAGKVALKEGKIVSKGIGERLTVLKNPSVTVKLGLAVIMPCLFLVMFGLAALSGMATQHPVAYMMSLGLSVMGSLVLAAYSIGSVTRPLKDLAVAAACAASGDFTHNIQARSNDEIGRLQDLLGTMNKNMRRIMHNIRKSVDIVEGSSQEIAQGNVELSMRTENQARNLEKTAASMEELTSTVKQNAENSKQANKLGSQASAVAVKGGETVGQVVKNMNSIHESSKRVVDIISVIDEIAFQTNILALNAAVEAARAGEQGRGFAVVATEVRMLAQRSAVAAKEIKELINDSVDKVECGTQLVGNAGKIMEEIVVSVKQVTDIMTEITAASQEQSTGIEQINEAMMQMDNVTHQNTSLVEEVVVSTEIMQNQAQNLTQSIAVLKLGQMPENRISTERRNQIRKYAAEKVQQKKDRRSENRPTNVMRLPKKDHLNARVG